METKLGRIAEISIKTRKPEFTSLYHHINEDMLRKCHIELDGKKAVGIDRVTKAEYEVNLEENISNLVERLKKKAYKPLPSLRVFIPKGNGKMRPLGIASYEDKMVQLAVKKILEAMKLLQLSVIVQPNAYYVISSHFKDNLENKYR